MRIAVAYEAGQPLVIQDVPTPAIGPRDVLVRIAASGICHTDLTIISGQAPIPLPTVPGHEACGIVEAVGADVRRVQVGDRVLASVSPACGSCWWCLNGMSNHCELGNALRGKPRFDLPDGRTATAVCGCGAWGEAMVVDEATVVAVRTDLPDEQLALIGCGVSTGLGAALNTAQVTPGSSVAVIGCGGVGQAVIQGAHIAGAAQIIAVDLAAGRRDAAINLGATHAVDPGAGDSVQQVLQLTGGIGVDFSFEVVGQPDLIVQAFNMARPEGAVTLVGMPAMTSTVTLPSMALIFTGKRLQGSVTGGSQILRDFPRYIKLAESGRLDLSSMVSNRIKLDEVNEGIEAARHADGIRTVIV